MVSFSKLGHTKLILCFMNYSSQKKDTIEREDKKEKSKSHQKAMNFIRSIVKFIFANLQLKQKKHLTVSRTADSSNEERMMGDKDIM